MASTALLIFTIGLAAYAIELSVKTHRRIKRKMREYESESS